MEVSRRAGLLNLLAATLLLGQQAPDEQQQRRPTVPPNPDEDTKLPNGKSQKDAMAKADHAQALKDVDELITVAEQLRTELQKSGEHVVSVTSVKKTEEIERLAKKIRGHLKS